jgi:hypothetical protein
MSPIGDTLSFNRHLMLVGPCASWSLATGPMGPDRHNLQLMEVWLDRELSVVRVEGGNRCYQLVPIGITSS